MEEEGRHWLCTNGRRRKLNWSSLHNDLLLSILDRLSYMDILCFRAVCSSWRLIAKTHISTPLYQPPWLMLPCEDDAKKNCCLYSLAEKKFYKHVNMPTWYSSSYCVISSNGWLVRVNRNENLSVFNPFSGLQIQLPSLYDPTGFESISRTNKLRCLPLTKAVVWSDSICRRSNFGVVGIWSPESGLAYARFGYSKWTFLKVGQKYSDIICFGDHIYALTNEISVEVWECNNSVPMREMMKVEPPVPDKMLELRKSLRGLFSEKHYIVESLGDILLVVRYIGEFVRTDGVVVHEADLFHEENQHLICPYMTKMFHVYKLDFYEIKWMEVKNLDDHALFLGGNESMSLSARDFPKCKKNSIYFTDDYWSRMHEKDAYGSHDMGVFGLEDESIEHISLQMMRLPPFWVVPNIRHRRTM